MRARSSPLSRPPPPQMLYPTVRCVERGKDSACVAAGDQPCSPSGRGEAPLPEQRSRRGGFVVKPANDRRARGWGQGATLPLASLAVLHGTAGQLSLQSALEARGELGGSLVGGRDFQTIDSYRACWRAPCCLFSSFLCSAFAFPVQYSTLVSVRPRRRPPATWRSASCSWCPWPSRGCALGEGDATAVPPRELLAQQMRIPPAPHSRPPPKRPQVDLSETDPKLGDTVAVLVIVPPPRTPVGHLHHYGACEPRGTRGRPLAI